MVGPVTVTLSTTADTPAPAGTPPAAKTLRLTVWFGPNGPWRTPSPERVSMIRAGVSGWYRPSLTIELLAAPTHPATSKITSA